LKRLFSPAEYVLKAIDSIAKKLDFLIATVVSKQTHRIPR
jgi:hypothetical protein